MRPRYLFNVIPRCFVCSDGQRDLVDPRRRVEAAELRVRAVLLGVRGLLPSCIHRGPNVVRCVGHKKGLTQGFAYCNRCAHCVGTKIVSYVVYPPLILPK